MRERLYEWHPGRARRWRRYSGIERLDPAGEAVLTFDDGPDEDATPAVLDALDEAGATATFFVLAEQLERHAELAREMQRRGHEVALHGFGHERHDRIAAERSRDDVLRGFSVLCETLEVTPRWYRPPFGKMSEASAAACSSLGMLPVYWSAWGLDWEQVDAERIADVACGQLDEGGIVLLHDSARYARRTSARPTAEAIPLIAERASERGLSLTSLGKAVRR
jgi:peptidoglycan/xylan/chitin deacetylase (PgdA/CDA1 family)